MLIMITGLPGTGKTTFAGMLAKELNATHLNSDMVRTQMGKRGHYDTASKAAVYNEMQNRAADVLSEGRHLVLDATLYKKILREPFELLAQKYKTRINWIELKADEEVIKDRVGKKRKYSEADFEVYLKIKAAYEPMERAHLVLWSNVLTLEEMTRKAKEYFEIQGLI